MRKFLILICMAFPFLASGQETDYPATPDEVAQRFAAHYEAGEQAAALYVLYEGKHLNDLGTTAGEIEKELLPEELKKHAKLPAVPESLKLTFSASDETYGQDTYYVSYISRGKPHKFTMFLVDGRWKADLSYLWMGDWYDWMPF